MPQAKVGVIGGSALYNIEGLTDIEMLDIDTPFGKPSDHITVGKLEGMGVAFLPRHGKGHRLSPTEVPYRVNIYALKSLGVEQIISVSAVGSLNEELKAGSLVVPDQLIDHPEVLISCPKRFSITCEGETSIIRRNHIVPKVISYSAIGFIPIHITSGICRY